MKSLSLRLSRLLLLLSTSLLVILCLNLNSVKGYLGGEDKRQDFLKVALDAKFLISETDLQEMSAFVKEKYGEIDLDNIAYFGFKFSTNRLGLYVFGDRTKLQFVDNRQSNNYIKTIYNPAFIHFVFDTNNSNKLIEKKYYSNGNLNLDIYTNQEQRIVYNFPNYLERHLFTFNDLLKEKGLSKSDKNFFSGLFNGLIQALLFPLNLIKQAVDGVMNAVNSIGSMITGAINAMSNAIKEALSALGNFIIEGLKSLFIPSQSELMELLDKFKNWFVLKFGALGQVLVFLTQFVSSLTNGARTFVVDLPPISLFGIQIINLDYDISEVTRTYKVLYDSYYMFASAGIIFSFMGYLTTQMDTLFND